ncbi:MAG: hypothetical protein LUD72_13700 [Bacteroidales bacterium]|nr:hypothetical protein [Bacteroidales bacterium]
MGWIDTISNSIETAFESVRTPLTALPTILMIPELHTRSGLSAISLTSSIIERLPEAGIETGVNPDGSENMVNSFVRIIVEELIQEIKDNARITAVIEPSSLVIQTTGANAGGPVTCTGTNLMPTQVLGLLE